jgi:hypothetical protein
MNQDQALNILKQFIDAGIKMGVCQNLESAATVAKAWETIIKLKTEKNDGI